MCQVGPFVSDDSLKDGAPTARQLPSLRYPRTHAGERRARRYAARAAQLPGPARPITVASAGPGGKCSEVSGRLARRACAHASSRCGRRSGGG